MAIAIQYNKKSVISGHDLLIPHVLDAVCLDIIKIMVFVTHPFAKQLCRIIYPEHKDMVKLWHTHLFVNFDRLFETFHISQVLQEASFEAFNQSICHELTRPY